MKRKLAYLSTSFLAAVLAVILHFSFATAQQPSGGHPTPECEACAQACRDEFEACKQTNGTSKSAFGQCARELEQCAAACRKPGGACNPQTEPGSRRR